MYFQNGKLRNQGSKLYFSAGKVHGFTVFTVSV